VPNTYDLTYLKEVSKGNDDFMLEMIDLFLTKTPETLLILEAAINDMNWDQTGFYAHKLKATYAYMGMHDLKEILVKIEKNAKILSELESIPALFKKLKTRTQPAMQEINEYKSSLVRA
jgi:HPt (histidine-containing phosphotransfer) domain-containing protein